MTTTTTVSPKLKGKVRTEQSAYGAENPTFFKLYCAAYTGLLSQPMTDFHPDHGEIPIYDKREKLQRIKGCGVLAFSAAIVAMQEFEMAALNKSVEHES